MQLHELKKINKLKRRKKIGRGGKKGTYSGKGMKGQRSRAGRKFQPIIRELIKKYPKKRGYRNRPGAKSRKIKTVILNLEILEKKFNSGENVNIETLLDKGLVQKKSGKAPKVKILSKGKISKKLTISGCRVSESAKKEIEKADGAVKLKS